MAESGEIEAAVERAMRRVLMDEELRRQFWNAGYRELAERASDGASQWVGRRLLIAFVWACVGAGIAWLVKTGVIK